MPLPLFTLLVSVFIVVTVVSVVRLRFWCIFRASYCIIKPSEVEEVARMTKPREGLYAWVTWLSKLMAGEVQCHWGAWFKTHYTDYRTEPIDAKLAGWTVEHNQYLTELINERAALGEVIYKEDQNKFRVRRSSGLVIAGKPDLITYNKTTGKYMVYDVKTGNQRQSDIIQVMLYCYCLPYASAIYKGKRLNGCVVYKTDRVEVPSEMVDDAFTKKAVYFLNILESPSAPDKFPSSVECGYCDLSTQDCPEKIQSSDTDDFDQPEGEIPL
jgi:hypothetical protein